MRSVAAALLVLVALGAFAQLPSTVEAAACDRTVVGAGNSTLVSGDFTAAAGCVSVVEAGGRLIVDGSVHVNGVLRLDRGASLLFRNLTVHTLNVALAGRMVMDQSTVAAEHNVRYNVTVLGTLEGRNTTARGELLTPYRLTLAGQAQPGLPLVANMTVRRAHEGIWVEDARPRLESVEVLDGPGAGLTVQRSTVTAENSVLRGNNLGIVAGSGARVAYHNGTLANRNKEATVTAPDASVRLIGTTNETGAALPPSECESFGGGAVTLGSWLKVRTVDSAGAGVGEVSVHVRNLTNEVVAAVLTRSDGHAAPMTLVSFRIGAAGVEAFPQPYRVRAQKAHNLAASDVDSRLGNETRILVMPQAPDNAPPTWTTSDPLQAPGGAFNRTGRPVIQWTPATDGAEPHNISHYVVYLARSGGLLAPFAQTTQLRATLTLDSPGTFQARVQPVDLAGNQGVFSNTVSITYDPQRPAISHRILGVAGNWSRTEVVVHATAADDRSGIASFTRRVEGPFQSGTSTPHTANLTLTSQGRYKVVLEAVDRAGNVQREESGFGIDRAAPVTTTALRPALAGGDGGWHTAAPRLYVNASDELSGVHAIRYRYAGTDPWTSLPMTGTLQRAASLSINRSGALNLEVNVTDVAGNFVRLDVPLKVDLEPPAIEVLGLPPDARWSREPLELTIRARDNHSGLRRLQYALDFGGWNDVEGAPIRIDASGTTLVLVRASDRAGTERVLDDLAVRIDRDPPTPGRLLASSPAPQTVDLDWSSVPPDDRASGVGSILVERRVGPTATPLEVGEFKESDEATLRQSNVPPGAYEYRLRVKDAAGNEASTSWVAVSVEGLGGLLDAGPEYRVEGLAVLRPLSPLSHVEAVKRVYFFIDGESVGETEAAPYEMLVDTRNYKDGAHQYSMLVLFQSGSIEERGTWLVDNDRPLTWGHEWTLGGAAFGLLGANAIVFLLRRRFMGA